MSRLFVVYSIEMDVLFTPCLVCFNDLIISHNLTMLLLFQDLRIATTVAVVIGLFLSFAGLHFLVSTSRSRSGHTVQESWFSRPYDFANVDSFGKQVASVQESGLKSRHLWLPQQRFSASVSKDFSRIVL